MKPVTLSAPALVLGTVALASPVRVDMPAHPKHNSTLVRRVKEGDAGLSITLYEWPCNSDPNVVVTPTFDFTYNAHNTLPNPASDGDPDDAWRVWKSWTLDRGLKDDEYVFFYGTGSNGDPCGEELFFLDAALGATGPGCWNYNWDTEMTCVILIGF